MLKQARLGYSFIIIFKIILLRSDYKSFLINIMIQTVYHDFSWSVKIVFGVLFLEYHIPFYQKSANICFLHRRNHLTSAANCNIYYDDVLH